MDKQRVARELVKIAKELVAREPSFVYDTGKGFRTPWGKADFRYDVMPGVAFYETPSHGGLGVGRSVAKKYLTPAAQKIGEHSGSMLWFEEDVAITAPLYEHPEWAAEIGFSGNVANYKKTLESYFPEYFEDDGNDVLDLKSLRNGDVIFFAKNFSFPMAEVIGYRGRSLIIRDNNGKDWRLGESQFDWAAERIERNGKVIWKKK